MILGIGTDIVQVDRFEKWQNYSCKQLRHIFSEQELSDCSRKDTLDVQCLASRFAAKEAFYKALSASLVKLKLTEHTFSLMFACPNVEVIKPIWGIPSFKVNWQIFENKVKGKIPKLQASLSISHEKRYAIAFVVIF